VKYAGKEFLNTLLNIVLVCLSVKSGFARKNASQNSMKEKLESESEGEKRRK
jgi:hypothetical protein